MISVLRRFCDIDYMAHSILWQPEHLRCTVCGIDTSFSRRYTKDLNHSVFCEPCWNAFTVECGVSSELWTNRVKALWSRNIAFVLSPKGVSHLSVLM
jgi:hypothetical protein